MNPPGGADAVHDRHLDVHENQVVGIFLKFHYGFFTVAYRGYNLAQHLQLFFDDLHVDGVVFGQQNAQTDRVRRLVDGRFGPFLFLFRRRTFFERRRKPKGRSLSGPAGKADDPAHHLHQLLADGQSQSGTAEFARHGSIDLGKGLKEFTVVLLRDADAGVGHCKSQDQLIGGFIFRGNRKRDGALPGKLDGIAEKIHQYLPQPDRVAGQPVGDPSADVAGVCQAFLLGLEQDDVLQVRQQVLDIECNGLHIQFAGFYFGKVQNIVDDGQQ